MNVSQPHPSSPAAPADSTARDLASPAGSSFADRVRLLIQRVGSATEIARMCGFSEGVVRSWRDGNSDPSRARCVTLARTLGISLVWLVAGEGAIQPEPRSGPGEEQASTSTESREHRLRGDSLAAAVAGIPADRMTDARRLDAARAMLRADLSLCGGDLAAAEQERLLGELYDIMGPGGAQIDASALLAFQQRLAQRLHSGALA